MCFHRVSGYCSGVRHIHQNQPFEMAKSKLVKVDFIIGLVPEEIARYAIERPVLLFHLETGLKLYDRNIGGGSKTDVGTDYSTHEHFGILLEILSKRNDISFRQLPAMAVKVTLRNGNFNRMGMQTEFVLVFVFLVVTRFFEHAAKHLILPWMITEIDWIAVIILKESLYIGFTRDGYVKFHRSIGFHS